MLHNNLNICVGKNIRKLRDFLKISELQLATLVGDCSEQQIKDYEKGICKVPFRILLYLKRKLPSEVYGYNKPPISYFFEGYISKNNDLTGAKPFSLAPNPLIQETLVRRGYIIESQCKFQQN